MSIVFLDGKYLPMEEAKISPLDRGFLFGDGIYEVIPSYDGRMVGFAPHIDRMQEGLGLIGIQLDWHHEQWRDLCNQLMSENGGGNLGIYLHVSRGADTTRFHAYPDNVTPTVFAFTFAIAPPAEADKAQAKGYRVSAQRDLRWERCNIKSTALLGNVMHFQAGYAAGMNETLLFNAKDELTEASSCNAYTVKNGVVATPPLDHQCLPGITRKILLNILGKHSDIKVEERIVTKEEVLNADEVWLTSSSKGVAPVTEIDGKPVGNGEIGDLWLTAQRLYNAHKFDY